MQSVKSRSIRRSPNAALVLLLSGCATSSQLDGGVDAGSDSMVMADADAGDEMRDADLRDSPADTFDAASHPVRYRFGNATGDPLTFCVQDWEGESERVPADGVLRGGEVSAWQERARGFVRLSWLRSDVPISESFCSGETASTTSIFTYDFVDVTFAVVGVEDQLDDSCGPTGEESCRPYGEVFRPIEAVAPLFSSSPPRLRVLNGSVRGTNTACFAEREYSALFGMSTFYESLRPVTDVAVGMGGCSEGPVVTWPFDASELAFPEQYWSTPDTATSATLTIVDGGGGELLAFPWLDAVCCE